jgi:ABC-type branched-subunit amino acid transport system permease subunit
MVELTGINADRVSAFAWALSSFLAGLAGVLLAPLFAQVNATNFTNLLLAAIVAAAFGGLSSIPLTFAGGILLGVVQQIVAGSLPLDSVLAQGLRPSLPFALLFLLLLFRPGLRERREVTDPLAGVDPPPPGLAATTRSEALTRLTRSVAIIAAAVLLGAALFRLDDYWLGLLTQAAIYSTIFLSITLVTGFGGMLSLCQATFAAVGAFAAAQLGAHFGLPVLPAIAVGAALAAVVGGLLALPALRLGGIHLALATLAFALMFDAVLVPLDWVGGGLRPVTVPRPLVAGIDFTNDGAWFCVCVAVLAATGTAIVRLRRRRTGRFLEALRGSEVGAMSVGIDSRRAKITAFAISAGIAGLGGGLLASQQGEANAALFSPFFGLFWVVLVVTLGARTVEGAVNAGLALMLFPEILEGLGLSPAYEFILFGLGAMTYARHPEGIVEANKRAVLAAIDRRIARRHAPTVPVGAPADTPMEAKLEP